MKKPIRLLCDPDLRQKQMILALQQKGKSHKKVLFFGEFYSPKHLVHVCTFHTTFAVQIKMPYFQSNNVVQKDT
jgi:hypothetical protein